MKFIKGSVVKQCFNSYLKKHFLHYIQLYKYPVMKYLITRLAITWCQKYFCMLQEIVLD